MRTPPPSPPLHSAPSVRSSLSSQTTRAQVLLTWIATPILSLRPTKLSASLRFLHENYQPELYWWELVEVYKKIVLVGVMAVVGPPETMTQLVVGLVLAVLFCVGTAMLQPFKHVEDNMFAT